MASQWYRQVDGIEVGPLTFQDLVRMILAGTLGEEDLVRRESNANWIRSRDVIGLFHTADRQRAAANLNCLAVGAKDAGSPAATETSTKPVPVKPLKPRFLEPMDYWILGVLAAFLLIVNLYCWWPESPGKFPPSRLRGAPSAAPEPSRSK